MPTPLKLAVFELGDIPDELSDEFPAYGTMIIRWLSQALPHADYSIIRPPHGEKLPAPTEFDGYIYSGSRHGVLDELPWISPLKQFIVATAAARRPQFGICFGHQIMAAAMGGVVAQVPRWGCGNEVYEFDNNHPAGPHVVPVMHHDQVIEAPASSRVVGRSAHCAIGALDYDAPLRSVQFHPEFSCRYAAALIRRLPAESIADEQREAALESLAQTPESATWAAWAAAFLSKNQKPQ